MLRLNFSDSAAWIIATVLLCAMGKETNLGIFSLVGLLAFMYFAIAGVMTMRSRTFELWKKTGGKCTAVCLAATAFCGAAKYLRQNYEIAFFDGDQAVILCAGIMSIASIHCLWFLSRYVISKANARRPVDEKKEEFFHLCPELKGKGVAFTEWEKSIDIDYRQFHLNVAIRDNFPRDTRERFGLDTETKEEV